MNFEIILLIALVLSSAGIISLILRKKSEIAFLPGREHFPEIKKFIKREKSKANFFLKEKSTQWENILQKLLLRARIVFLRADNKILNLTQKLKQRKEKKRPDKYWKDIKMSLKKNPSQKDRPA